MSAGVGGTGKKVRVKVALHGCDDSTYVTRTVSPEMLAELVALTIAVREAATYGCQPILEIEVQPDLVTGEVRT